MTEAQRTHPPLDRLIAFRLGRLPDGAGAEIQIHLKECASCRALADSLDPEALLPWFQASMPTPPPTATVGPPPNSSETETLPPESQPVPIELGIPAELANHPRYRVLELLGSGGMGRVFKAEHRIMERFVALKVINRNLMDNPAAVERFRREVRTAARLLHPNIVTAYDAEQVQDCHFLVMEYVEGQSLDRVMQTRGRLPIPEACGYIRQAALGLQHAHERGMVHRDIKPQNMMRTQDGIIKVLDFGLARFLSEGKPATALTQFGVIMGTPDYIAPEQAHDPRTADIRADLYSLGCTLYYLLAGCVPFPDGSLLQKLMAQVDKTPTPLTQLRTDTPPHLVRVVDRMMRKDPAARYQAPVEVVRELAYWSANPEERPTAEYVPSGSLQVETPHWTSAKAPGATFEETELVPEVIAVPVEARAEPPGSDDRLQVLPVHEEEETRPKTRRTKSQLAYNLGIASIILGVLSLPVGCLSCLGFAGAPVTLLGLLLGGAGLIVALSEGGRPIGEWAGAFNLRDRRIGFPFAGAVLNGAALILTLLMAIGARGPFGINAPSRMEFKVPDTPTQELPKTKK